MVTSLFQQLNTMVMSNHHSDQENPCPKTCKSIQEQKLKSLKMRAVKRLLYLHRGSKASLLGRVGERSKKTTDTKRNRPKLMQIFERKVRQFKGNARKC